MTKEEHKKFIDELYEEVGDDFNNKEVKDVCYDALKAYCKFRIIITILSDEQTYNSLHADTLDKAVDISDIVIQSYRKFHAKSK